MTVIISGLLLNVAKSSRCGSTVIVASILMPHDGRRYAAGVEHHKFMSEQQCCGSFYPIQPFTTRPGPTRMTRKTAYMKPDTVAKAPANIQHPSQFSGS